MSLLIFFWHNPRLDSVKDHVVHSYSVTEMDWSLDSKDSKDFQLDRGKVVKKVVELDVLSGGLDTLINCDDKLIGLLDGELPLCINNSLNTRLDELLLEKVQVLEVIFFVYKVMFEWSNRALHVEHTSLLALESHGTYSHEMAHDCFGSDHS